jgi:hypothetical protein
VECRPKSLGTETVQSSALSLERVDDVERGDGLALGVLGVGDRVTDDVLELEGQNVQCQTSDQAYEDLQDTTGLLVDEARDTLDTSTTGETTDRGLGDTPGRVSLGSSREM